MCKRCRTVLEHPASAHSGTLSMNKHLKGPQCQRGIGKPSIYKLLSTWEQKLLNLVIVSHLPFLFLEYQEFYDLISYARLAPTTPTIPSRKVIRTRLCEFVTENQTTTLRSLPPDVKLSLALDCWTSPFQQAFMAITDYREVLLGFEPLSGTHLGANLSEVIHQILDRVLAITTDNASNNTTLIAVVNDTIQALKLNTKSVII
ncbi:hypothetical protein N7505_007575 [Penicillium chrysogenum]|uniref:AC transposase n=1 Tax=Penicillium chrysogenum TaxID=5076 RepID=A0ABQ8WDV1_PENCH|nr:hypothetical protein N7505_007572 [Penicillium chrysogenum]KAJ5264782.1 hypothetical protein N7505_007575 [Penicillium chrysogenum]